MREDAIIEKVQKKIKGQDMICKNCKFNFDGICAAHDSHWGYGKKILLETESCYEWGISFEFFNELAKS